ncbi:MAG: hypothetical protein BHW57_05560 [Azospirillum sp. 47_25]|nr:MAG: hypothetical protein BHW57_05560 [Azospirillum sp. 47_25]
MGKTAIEIIAENIELPDSYYETAKSRYEDLGEFLCTDSNISMFEPKVFPQGSFRLGTAIKPLNGNSAYDLDLTCRLEKGFNSRNSSQKELKDITGKAIDDYIQKRGIKEGKEEKRRCWRINYQGNINFHMDIVPGIPLNDKKFLVESMKASGMDESLSGKLADFAYNITDNKTDNYNHITQNWPISNPEGYAQWFESRMRLGVDFVAINKAHYEELPFFKRKTILQRSVQILKRHRDIMFQKNDDVKPVSIIITTLAARAYQGERELDISIFNILTKMEEMLNNKGYGPRVPNPTKPEEDFADKWKEDPQLEKNFYMWIMQAKADLCNIKDASSLNAVFDKAHNSFGLILNESMFEEDAININKVPIKNNRIEVAKLPKPHMK